MGDSEKTPRGKVVTKEVPRGKVVIKEVRRVTSPDSNPERPKPPKPKPI